MEIYSIKKVAWMLNVNPETVRLWIRNGRLKASMKNNREGYRISPYDFLDFYETYKKWEKRK